MIELISIGINVILLIVFMVMASNIGSMRRILSDMYTNGYKQYSCGQVECKRPFFGKQANCPSCKKPVGW